MRRVLFLMVFVLSVVSVSADNVCKIGDGDSIEAMSCYFSNDDMTEVTVVLSNDSKDKNSNVTVTIEADDINGKVHTFTEKTVAKADGSTVLKIPVLCSIKLRSVRVLSISGTRCQ